MPTGAPAADYYAQVIGENIQYHVRALVGVRAHGSV